MKNSTKTIILATIAILFTSCNKDIITPDYGVSEDSCLVTVKVNSPLTTKATGLAENGDLTVNSLQVFAFLDGNLDVYGSSSSNEVQINCTQGERKFYAVINAPSLAAITTETGLLNATSNLSDSSLTSLQMIGSKTDTISAANTSVEIQVGRIASRIILSSIKKNFSSSSLNSQTFKVNKIYLVNASGSCKYGTPAEPVTWCNKIKLDSTLDPKLAAFMADAPEVTLQTNVAYSTSHTFYCYPNGTKDDSSATGTFSPRYTRLVIEAQLGNKTMYYPISLPEIKSNHSYNISEVTITKPGSPSADEPVSTLACTFTLEILPWANVSVTEGTSI